MDLLMFIFVTVIPVISDGLTVDGPSGPLIAPLGSSVVLPCSVDKPLPLEDLEVAWRRTDSDALVHLFQDGESQPQQDYQDRAHFFTEEIQHGNFSLRLDNLRVEDEGEYTCTVHSQEESAETVVEIQVDNVESLRVTGSKQSLSASVGEDVTLSCSVDSQIPPEELEVSWMKTDEEEDIVVLLYQDNEALPEGSNERYRDRVEFFTDETPKGNFSLRLKRVRTEDKGVYMCEVFAGGLSANTTVELEQLGFSALHIMVLILCISASGSALLLCCLIYCRSPTKGLIVQNSNHNVHLGSSVVFPCHVPPNLLTKDTKVEWRRKSKKSETLVHLYEGGDIQAEKQLQEYKERAHFFIEHIKQGNFSLRLDKLTAEDEGLYTCTVRNKKDCVFSAETKLVLNIFMKAFMGDKVIPLGGSVDLPCQVDKSLLENSLKVEWRRAETQVHLYQDCKIRAKEQHKDYQKRANFLKKKIKDGNFSLRLKKLRAADVGVYTCNVYKDQDCVRSAKKELKLVFTVKHSDHTTVPLGSSMTLPCFNNKPSRMEDLKVEWKKKGLQDLVHHFQDGESQSDKQQHDYQDRTHLFTEHLKDGNFSLRLDKLRAEDAGKYTCHNYRQFSTNITLVLKLLDTVFHLQMFLVFCPNILMFLAFVLWGVSEGSLSETVSCCALYFLRPLLLLWAAPYLHLHNFTDKIKTRIQKYSYVAEFVVLSLVVYSALFTSAWQKLLSYGAFDRAVIIVLFVIVFVCCFCKIIYILVTEVGKKSGRAIKIFNIVADLTFEILPTLQFMLLFYTFGAAGAEIIMIILPVLMMMTNERWFDRCYYRLNFSLSVVRTVMLVFVLVTNAVMIGVYIFTLADKTDAAGWGCVIVLLQILWMVMRFTDSYYFNFDEDFHRVVPVYVFGSVGVVLLNSAALITELILKTVIGRRIMADLRFTVFPSECLFAIFVLISALFPSTIANCLQSCQNKLKSMRVKRSRKNQSTGETEATEEIPLNTGDQEQNQPDSVVSQT